ncbi:glyoxylase-like metal-dependent hydrolase (beta-lactamase superfamily II) [Georgenia soli]|uniref:Glyoxylase-like metal-dependent hydrolase (Beta-lactamase superfamily II) n=1 Tax=Georgenia soli TaxID=638953 RepID=A0A2A9EPL4_9MICO|nr:MBL fold metallo-hydrolase [Georgenia soli]PFG40212.1 glyoxylase-like metal-dependent hydrolase (beta-lactamase superfamily II) [Georgenia soli]
MAGPYPERIAPGVHLLTVGRGVAASNVYLVRSAGGPWVLVDAGWGSSAPRIEAAAELLLGPGVRPAAILLTHIHPDHSGAAGTLARAWEVPVHVHADEVVMAAGRYLPDRSMPLDRWVVAPLMGLLPARRREAVEAAGDITDVVRPLDPTGVVPGLPDWEYVLTPGHTPGHVAYRRRSDGVVLSGDAVLTVNLNSLVGALSGRQRLAGPPWLTTWDREAARRSVNALAALRPRILAPGHGRPLVLGTGEPLRHLAQELTPAPRRTVRGAGRLAPGQVTRGVLRPPRPGVRLLRALRCR